MPPLLLPEDAMLAALAGTTNRGTFEAHVTTSATDEAARDRFQTVCGELGVKAVLIDLPEGVTPSQPMTSSYHRGEVRAAAEAVADLARRVRAAGFAVLRVKLEAVTTNDGVPQTDDEPQPAGRYFEYHVKLLLTADADETALRWVCDRHAAKLSRNAFKANRNGTSERFVTLRAYGVGRVSADAHLAALTADLAAAGFNVANTVREYALFDSHAALDAGWIDHPAEVPA